MHNIFLVALTVIVGLLWAGTIKPEMQWTATMFGLALAAIVLGGGAQAGWRGRRRHIL